MGRVGTPRGPLDDLALGIEGVEGAAAALAAGEQAVCAKGVDGGCYRGIADRTGYTDHRVGPGSRAAKANSGAENGSVAKTQS
jgi:hypothetical protein